ncbi:MAG: bifunctional diaminohydroxyphosphoribosylaminopyrimidine deaminase/5-amino-6-(5-phosphoribosylamino)uracil reductase RibD [Nitrospira sp.]|nr:bifunctional diaminohydroxyphosphoribosylaminopyrimidine deaminase/5-amino-6-(5-phosphoribosylamino)uracil reductase RibD [Nitrospira sp.]
MNDELYMKRTFHLALKAQGMTSPNPMVGAILVKSGRIIAEDYHKEAGTPHAEALAIEKAEEKVKGSTLYVNLEPCCHTEKRTPPCTKAIISAGIKEVVIAMIDPNPKVSGMGIMEIQKAGIKVKTGILEDKAKRLNETYIKYIVTGKPFVILKAAMTLDGKIATPEGQSKWITSEKSRSVVHRIRSNVDAIITAIGTVKADDPQLTARIQKARGKGQGTRNPKRIVIDPDLEIPLDAKVLQVPPETIIVTRKFYSSRFNNTPESSHGKVIPPCPPLLKGGWGDFKGVQGRFSNKVKKNNLREKGIQIIEYDEKLNLNWLMEKLGKMKITSVLIEGGSSLNAHALADNIVDKVMFFIAPKIMGGKESFPAVGGKSFRRLEDAYCLKDVKIKRIGEDILVEGYVITNQ